MNLRIQKLIILIILSIRIAIPGYSRNVVSESIETMSVDSAAILPVESVSETGLHLSAPDTQVDIDRLTLPDSIPTHGRSYAENDWWRRLREWDLDMNDTSVRYPGFLNFCVKVYRWFDRTFNSHDPEYVFSDPYRWKAFLVSDSWTDAYSFGSKDMPALYMLSSPYITFGPRIKYMALSAGYSFDINTILLGQKNKHDKWDFGIACARFNLELHLWRTEGGTTVRKFGDYNNGRLIRKPFKGLTFQALQFLGYYMFNSKKFSMGAAYSFLNNQRRSAGTPIAGIDISSYIVDFDFTQLPIELKNYYQYPFDTYKFHYQSYRLTGGYSYNWVANRHFVLNILALPGIGFTNSDYDSSYGHHTLFSVGGKTSAALSYTNRKFFLGASAAVTVTSFVSNSIRFFSAIQNYQLSLGIKF